MPPNISEAPDGAKAASEVQQTNYDGQVGGVTQNDSWCSASPYQTESFGTPELNSYQETYGFNSSNGNETWCSADTYSTKGDLPSTTMGSVSNGFGDYGNGGTESWYSDVSVSGTVQEHTGVSSTASLTQDSMSDPSAGTSGSISGEGNTSGSSVSGARSSTDGLSGTSSEFDNTGGSCEINFDGQTARVQNHQGETHELPATSGLPGTTPYDQGLKNQGPLPEGTYTLNPSEFSEGSWIRDLTGDWGDWRAPLHPEPGTDVMGRSDFFVHGGEKLGSQGCIDVGHADTTLHDALKDCPGDIKVTVDYPEVAGPFKDGHNMTPKDANATDAEGHPIKTDSPLNDVASNGPMCVDSSVSAQSHNSFNTDKPAPQSEPERSTSGSSGSSIISDSAASSSASDNRDLMSSEASSGPMCVDPSISSQSSSSSTSESSAVSSSPEASTPSDNSLSSSSGSSSSSTDSASSSSDASNSCSM